MIKSPLHRLKIILRNPFIPPQFRPLAPNLPHITPTYPCASPPNSPEAIVQLLPETSTSPSQPFHEGACTVLIRSFVYLLSRLRRPVVPFSDAAAKRWIRPFPTDMGNWIIKISRNLLPPTRTTTITSSPPSTHGWAGGVGLAGLQTHRHAEYLVYLLLLAVPLHSWVPYCLCACVEVINNRF